MMDPGPRNQSRSAIPVSIIFRCGILALAWVLLTEGDFRDWWLGGIIVVLACGSSYLVFPVVTGTGMRWRGFLQFAGYFLLQSLRGGIDVLSRALSPSLPLRPGFIEIDLNLPTEGMRVLLAWTISLLPGTASVALIEKRLVIHALFQGHSIHAELQRLETVISELT